MRVLADGISLEYIATDVAKLGECEFSLISEMNSQLIIHHPYRTLSELQNAFSMTADEVALAWSIINDHYLTDLPLLHPPHVIALTAIFLAVVLKPSQNNLHNAGVSASALTNAISVARDQSNAGMQTVTPGTPQMKIQKLITLLADSNVSIEAIVDCTQEIVSLYEVWEQYSEKVCREQIARFVRVLK